MEQISKQRSGKSSNPIIFNDYESFIAKFSATTPKTTDDCYTPPDVYEAVVKYVGEIYNMCGKQILRPFFPDGDYEHDEYPDNGVVIDNPPFSIFSKIVRFYVAKDIPFFLFGPSLTIFQTGELSTAILVDCSITFHNGAKVPVSFVTNLMPDVIAVASPRLRKRIMGCPSQLPRTKALGTYTYPDNVVSVSTLRTISKGEEEFAIRRSEAQIISRLDAHTLFGKHLLVSKAAAAKVAAKVAAAKAAAKVAAAKAATPPLTLSEREKAIVDSLQ